MRDYFCGCKEKSENTNTEKNTKENQNNDGNNLTPAFLPEFVLEICDRANMEFRSKRY